MKLFDKKSLILLISVISINMLCIISVSYAYFSAQIKGNEDAKEMTVHAGTMTITYADTNTVSLNNALPGDSVTKTFKVENTGTLDAKYNIKIDVNTNEFEDYSDLTYILTKNDVPQEEKVLPYEDGYIVVDSEIASTTIDNYSLKVTFKKDDSNQNDNANKKVDFTIVVDSNDNVSLYEYKEPYKDNSGANRPKLYQGMIPIRFTEENTMVIADITDTENPWYDYDEHKWGNAVLIDNTNQDIVNKFYNEDGTLKINQAITEEDILQMYVWIPRYKYQLFNAIAGENAPEQMINIEFEKGVTSTGDVTCEINNLGKETCENAINGNWYTHPAFTFGDTELPGIWIGKFEPSDPTDLLGTKLDEISEITILPNKTSMISKNIKVSFEASRSIEKDLKYNLNPTEVDTHMLKNRDWGAVAYLTNSKYGRYINNNECIDSGCEVWINNTIQSIDSIYGGTATGCSGLLVSSEIEHNTESGTPAKCSETQRWNMNGVNASTTGNIYGIYDMSGGTTEYVMGNMVDANGTFSVAKSSGFETSPEVKYYDKYEYGVDRLEHQRGHLGDATREVSKNSNNLSQKWFNDSGVAPSESVPFITRGNPSCYGASAGLYSASSNGGERYGYRGFRVVLTAQDGTT